MGGAWVSIENVNVAELCVQGLEWTAPSSVCSGIRPFFITQKTISSQYFQEIILSVSIA